MHTDRCGKSRRQKYCAKGSGKEIKIQEFMYRDTKKYRKYCSVKLEAWAVGITAGSREVPGRKGLWQETSISNNNNSNNNNNNNI